MYSRHNNRNNYNYKRAIDSGSKKFNPLTVENPLTYCINDNTDKRFLVGGESDNLIGQQSEHCQLFLSEYCEFREKYLNKKYDAKLIPSKYCDNGNKCCPDGKILFKLCGIN